MPPPVLHSLRLMGIGNRAALPVIDESAMLITPHGDR